MEYKKGRIDSNEHWEKHVVMKRCTKEIFMTRSSELGNLCLRFPTLLFTDFTPEETWTSMKLYIYT